MASACALAIFSGKIIIHFGIAERLRTLRYSLFTEIFPYAKRLPHKMCSSLLFVYTVIPSGITPR